MVTISVRQRPRRRCSAVVEHRLADQFDLDLTVDARRGPHQDMIGVIVGRGSGVRRDDVFALSRPHRQRVAHDDPTARRVPRRRHDVRARLIGARRRDVDTERTKPEIPRLAVEQRPEHAGRVEPRHAQPRDAPVGRDQRTRMTVGEEPIVLDRRKRRWHRRTLLAVRRGDGHDLISLRSWDSARLSGSPPRLVRAFASASSRRSHLQSLHQPALTPQPAHGCLI